ncbi:sulfatase family protein [Algibacillus agarilyticus]|uniref:sulfatase family protein n=1 Tax=Algibacillus agarilyticus TaxID=2234133 RepID=UPI000DD00F32|nr:sulfatase [Algibacillus agarilyticus]
MINFKNRNLTTWLCALMCLGVNLLAGCGSQSAALNQSDIVHTETAQTQSVQAEAKNKTNVEQPNVIIIVADQMRRASLSLWQQPEFKNALLGTSDYVFTPNLDKLAQQGAVFNQAIANYPLCSPFRGMLLSGRFPNNNGVTNNTRIDRPNVGLRLDITTLTEVLAQKGYNTALVGKGHWNNNLPLMNNKNEYVGTTEAPGGHFLQGTKYDSYIPPGPARQGIEYWYQSIGHNHKSPLVYTNDTYLSKGKRDGQPFYPRVYSAVDQANVIIDYIDNSRAQRDNSKPFSLIWTMDPPHSPYKQMSDTDEGIYNKYYKDVAIETLLNRPNVDIARAEKFARYHFSMVTLVDREIGRVIEKLKAQGLDKNTLIVFTADHGEMMGSHRLMTKNFAYEESIGIPLIVTLDNRIKPHINDLLIGVPDFMPTILGLLNLDDAIPSDLDGVDYSDLLIATDNQPAKPLSSLYYGQSSQLGVRTDQYLYVLDKAGKIMNLFDIKQDPYQLTPLTPEQIPVADLLFLQQQLGYWLDKIKHEWAIEKRFPHHVIYPSQI